MVKSKQPTKTQKQLINMINSRGGVVYIEQSAEFLPAYYLNDNTWLKTPRIERLIAAGWLQYVNDGLFADAPQSLTTTIKERL